MSALKAMFVALLFVMKLLFVCWVECHQDGFGLLPNQHNADIHSTQLSFEHVAARRTATHTKSAPM